MKRSVLLFTAVLAFATLAPAQRDYSGPRPPKPDVPYLLHADTLVETEASEAREESRKNESVYTISGAASPVRTPLAEPVFLFLSEKISPDSLGLFRVEVKGGNRQVVLSKKKRDSRTLRLTATRLADKLYRIEVNEGMGLANGEYSLSPEGTNQVFCFAIY
jgi:hypothetical protein